MSFGGLGGTYYPALPVLREDIQHAAGLRARRDQIARLDACIPIGAAIFHAQHTFGPVDPVCHSHHLADVDGVRLVAVLALCGVPFLHHPCADAGNYTRHRNLQGQTLYPLYFQYLGLLVTEMYLDRYFRDSES